MRGNKHTRTRVPRTQCKILLATVVFKTCKAGSRDTAFSRNSPASSRGAAGARAGLGSWSIYPARFLVSWGCRQRGRRSCAGSGRSREPRPAAGPCRQVPCTAPGEAAWRAARRRRREAAQEQARAPHASVGVLLLRRMQRNSRDVLVF